MRYFNTTGPVVAAVHYRIPPLERVNLRELRPLVREGRYFVLHAPRQTGKTFGASRAAGLAQQRCRRCIP